MARKRKPSRPPDLLFVIDVTTPYEPLLPPVDPSENGWARIIPLEQYWNVLRDADPSRVSGLVRQTGRFLELWLNQKLCVQHLTDQEQELLRAIAFANYLKEEQILASVSLLDSPTDLPKLVKYSAAAEPFGRYPTDGNPAPGSGHGASLSQVRALWKALSECAERYAQTRYRREELVVTSFARLGPHKALDPRRLTTFSPAEQEQAVEFRSFTDATNFSWAQVVELKTGRLKWAPAQLFYSNYTLHKEPMLQQPISTGAAGPHTFAPRDPHLQLRKVIEALEATG